MSDKKEEAKSKKLREELEALKDEKLLLEEKLQLQSTRWLYSHNLSLSICLGVAYGAIIGNLLYLIIYFLNVFKPFNSLPLYVSLPFALFAIFGIPIIATFPLIVMLKAPSFASKSLGAYIVSFFIFESLILYVDPLQTMLIPLQYQGVDRLTSGVFPVTIIQFLFSTLSLLFAPQIAKRCGYRVVLDGSVFSFEVDADIVTVSKQLNKLEEDFSFVLDRSNSKPNKLFFAKISEKENIVLQIFLQPKENKTEVALVMHSITNDIPMRAGREATERIGKTLMKWIEVSNDFTVLVTENEHLSKVIREASKSFYRQPIALPSKRVVKEFLREHWKDIAVITSVIVAVLAWLFPLK